MDEIILGDAYELIKSVPDRSVDLIVTDPPYQIDGVHTKKGFVDGRPWIAELREEGCRITSGIDNAILGEFVRVMRKINIYLWCNKEQIHDYMEYFAKERGCNFEVLIWAKQNPPPFFNSHYLKDKEYCLYFWETGAPLRVASFDAGRTVFFTNVNMADKELYGHPTIKPQPIVEALIANSSVGGGVVLDPFAGSGTTLAAAKRLGRHYLGFEISPKYHAIAADRLKGITKAERESGMVQMKLF